MNFFSYLEEFRDILPLQKQERSLNAHIPTVDVFFSESDNGLADDVSLK